MVHSGTRVAVKVRHPGVGQAIARDFALMMFVARGVSWLPGMRRLRLEDSLKQFAAPLTEQVCIALCIAPFATSACERTLVQRRHLCLLGVKVLTVVFGASCLVSPARSAA